MDSHLIAVFRSEAQRQAVRGNHQAALDLLDQIPAAEAAVLRARILCQLGSFEKGAKCWQEALAADPHDGDAKRGLALAESLARSPIGKARLHARRWALGLVVLVVAAVGVWRAAAPGTPDRQKELADSMRKLERQVAEGNSSSRESINALTQSLEHSEAANSQAREQARAQLQRLQQSLRRVEKLLAETPRQ
jgi:tetratricopeptide (TPR) repeat protein